MLLSIPDGRNQFKVNGDNISPGISISNSDVGLASLSISAFFLRLICTNGMVAKTSISTSYRHVSTKILTELPQVFEKRDCMVEQETGAFPSGDKRFGWQGVPGSEPEKYQIRNL
jgi:hypothetical protein